MYTTPAAAQAPPAAPLDTMEILDNGLRQPLDQGRAARREPLAVKSRAHWLTVQCLDKPGSLAEIARLIAQHDQNIKVSNILVKLMLSSGPSYLMHCSLAALCMRPRFSLMACKALLACQEMDFFPVLICCCLSL